MASRKSCLFEKLTTFMIYVDGREGWRIEGRRLGSKLSYFQSILFCSPPLFFSLPSIQIDLY